MTKYIKIDVAEIREHLEHNIKIDYGGGNKGYRDYSIWCSDCQESIGNVLKVKSE